MGVLTFGRIKMGFISIFVGYFLLTIGSCQDHYRSVQILKYDNNVDDIANGAYNFEYETSDGQTRQESGHVLLPGTEDEHMKVNGSYSYVGPDGVTYTVRYTADDQGFHPEGDHFKVPPFVPWIHRRGANPAEEPTSGENILNAFRTTPKPTTEYLPGYGSGSDLYGSRARLPTTTYLPGSSTPSPAYLYGAGNPATSTSVPSSGYPNAEVILNALPQAQTPVRFFLKPDAGAKGTDKPALGTLR